MTRRQRFTGNRRMAPAIDPPEDRCARDGPLLSRPNIRELLHHSSPPPCFYFIIPAPSRGRIAVGAPTHIHARHNSPRKPAATRSPVRLTQFRNARTPFSIWHLLYTYRRSRPRYDIIPPAIFRAIPRHSCMQNVIVYGLSWNQSLLSRTFLL